jgi:hypothetical protein
MASRSGSRNFEMRLLPVEESFFESIASQKFASRALYNLRLKADHAQLVSSFDELVSLDQLKFVLSDYRLISTLKISPSKPLAETMEVYADPASKMVIAYAKARKRVIAVRQWTFEKDGITIECRCEKVGIVRKMGGFIVQWMI